MVLQLALVLLPMPALAHQQPPVLGLKPALILALALVLAQPQPQVQVPERARVLM
jgi:hypothetical protein